MSKVAQKVVKKKRVTKVEVEQIKRLPSVVFASDSPYYPTGFADQCGKIANIAARNMDWDVNYLGWQTRGNPDIRGFDYKIHGVRGEAPFGKDSYEQIFREVSPEMLFTQGDAHMVDVLAMKVRPFWLMYYPLDGDPINSLISNVLSKADVRIAMSKYGQQLTQQQLRLSVEYVPHGIDTNMFSPINKKAAKETIYDRMGIMSPIEFKDMFVFGCVARLNKRKHHIRLLEAFRIFLERDEERKKKCFLYLHLDPKDPLYIHDINHDYFFIEQIEVRGLGDNIIITPKESPQNVQYNFLEGLSHQDLCLLYNSFDVHVLPTGGEGFGIPTVESMSCEVPNIITDYTTSREFIAGTDDDTKLLDKEEQRGILVPPQNLYMERCGVKKAWIDIRKLVEAMEKYYLDPDLIKLHGERARKWVVDNYDWKVVEKMWIKLFEKVNTNINLV